VRGVANVRGSAIADHRLSRLFRVLTLSTPRKQRPRPGIWTRDGLFVGLLIDELLGMRIFRLAVFKYRIAPLLRKPQTFSWRWELMFRSRYHLVSTSGRLARDQGVFFDVAILIEGGGGRVHSGVAALIQG